MKSLKNTAIVTTVLAAVAGDLRHAKKFKRAPKAARLPAFGLLSAFLEERYGLLDDPKIHEEFEDRFYKQIVVPWCDLKEENE